jgi:predicted nuclease with TOPRIM domain
MSQLEAHIASLQQKVQLLIKKSQLLEKENKQLQTTLSQTKEKQQELKQELDITLMQNAIMKAAQQQLSGTEKKEMEKKLQGFMKEIDRCIAMLSR